MAGMGAANISHYKPVDGNKDREVWYTITIMQIQRWYGSCPESTNSSLNADLDDFIEKMLRNHASFSLPRTNFRIP
jgi:hypothetical protein